MWKKITELKDCMDLQDLKRLQHWSETWLVVTAVPSRRVR